MKTFSERVVECALSIPFGKVTTYGLIAKAGGGGNMASRSVTGILAKAYENGEKNIPFHRIVYSSGKIWMDERYNERRKALYKKEGIAVNAKGQITNFPDILYEFS